MEGSLLIFVTSILSFATFALFIAGKGKLKNIWFGLTQTKEGPSILKGIILFVGIGLAIAALGLLTGCSSSPKRGFDVTYANYFEVFMGLDNTFEQSPQCHGNIQEYNSNFGSDQLTSNGGFRFNVLESDDKRAAVNVKYTHHSCAFNKDRNGYDAIGLEGTYRPWVR